MFCLPVGGTYTIDYEQVAELVSLMDANWSSHAFQNLGSELPN